MLLTLLTYAVILLAILGLTYLIEKIWLYIIRTKASPPIDIVIHLQNEIAQAQIFEIIEKIYWCGDNNINNIFALYDNISEKELLICKEISKNRINYIKVKNTENFNWIQ